MAKKIIRHELVSINIPKGSSLTRFNVPDLPNLRNVHLFGVQVYYDKILTKDIISGNPVVDTTTVLLNSFITFVNYGGKEFLKQAPAEIFNTMVSASGQSEWDSKSFVGQKVNYPKSFVEFTSPPANPGFDTAYVFSVYYSLPIEEEKRESGYSFGNKG
jgi:hypothetical protein